MTLPYPSQVIGVVASFGNLSAMFLLPCLFSLRLLRLPWYEAGLCWVLVAGSAVLSVLGVVASVQQLMGKMSDGGGDGDGAAGLSFALGGRLE